MVIKSGIMSAYKYFQNTSWSVFLIFRNICSSLKVTAALHKTDWNRKIIYNIPIASYNHKKLKKGTKLPGWIWFMKEMAFFIINFMLWWFWNKRLLWHLIILLYKMVLLYPPCHTTDDLPLLYPLEDCAGLPVGEALHHHPVHRQDLVTCTDHCSSI